MARYETYTISIASLPVELRLPAGKTAAAARKRYGNFITGSRTPWRIEAEFTGAAAGGEPGNMSVTMRGGILEIKRGDIDAEIDTRARRGRAAISDSIYSLDTLLRAVYSQLAVGRGGLLAHSAGMLRAGRGYAFIGPSGSGKTTSASAASGGSLLSDEITALRIVNNRARVCGTPFMGEMGVGGERKSAAARGLYFLDRGLPAGKTPLPPAKAIKLLLASAINFCAEPAHVAMLLDNACAICSAAPCWSFSFDKNIPFWKQADNDKT
jgi:hypothetical protein